MMNKRRRQKAEGRTQFTPAFCILHSAFPTHRSAFSFTEVLFAVIILGIGFIMIAAMFPVAIQQTKTTTEETIGSTIARGAVNYIQSVATDVLMPATTSTNGNPGDVAAIAPDDPDGDDLWFNIRGNVILPNDPRYGWVALYRRGLDSGGNPLPYAQVVVIPTESRNRPIYQPDPDTLPAGSANNPVNLQARPLSNVDFTDGNAGIDVADVGTSAGANAVATGCYLVVAQGANVGRIFRVGNEIGGGEWELMPGGDMEENDGTSFSGDVFVVGRGAIDPTAPSYEGPAMDVGIYTTFVKVN